MCSNRQLETVDMALYDTSVHGSSTPALAGTAVAIVIAPEAQAKRAAAHKAPHQSTRADGAKDLEVPL